MACESRPQSVVPTCRYCRVFGLPADFKEGVIFSTYATLVSSVSRGGAPGGARASRLQQLVDWCGGDAFDGCLVFDECHKAKNFVPVRSCQKTRCLPRSVSCWGVLFFLIVLSCALLHKNTSREVA